MTEFLPENSDRNIKLRQYRDALAISGGVVIAFSLWDMITTTVCRSVTRRSWWIIAPEAG